MLGLYCAVVLLLVSLAAGERIVVSVDSSPVYASVNQPLTLNCTIPGYGILVRPTYVRWERQLVNSGGFHAITKDQAVANGQNSRFSVTLIPGNYTYWYRLTVKSVRKEDGGIYRCVASGPTHSHELSTGTVHVIV